jgi:hypothetical protein
MFAACLNDNFAGYISRLGSKIQVVVTCSPLSGRFQLFDA